MSLSMEQPLGQPHDRDDAAPPTEAIAVEVAAVDDDAMDTTPDNDGTIITPTSPADLSASQAPPAAPDAMNTPIDPFGALIDPLNPPQPPPPPPPIDPESESDDDDDDDDDDGMPSWHPIMEDMTAPNEVELKEIEGATEHSALDHDYWESKAFPPLEDPEYTAGASGRIEWTIDAYNGTREQPNRDLVMQSEPVTVGGYQWQIKFYPRGNDSDYLSVYVECLSVLDGKSRHDKQVDEEAPSEEEIAKDENAAPDTMETSETGLSDLPSDGLVEYQHAPVPLLGDKHMPKRKSVAAQVSVVLYNPTEPRVNHSKTALHRFCAGSPDWGWTRFHGPSYEIPYRTYGQRQALLRDDKLAFTAYIRIIKDETNCLWEHHSRENPWDSFAMTGLQSLMLGENASSPGGNMISAVASWLLFKPFRHLLYRITLPDAAEEPFVRPKPLLATLQELLLTLRTHVEPRAGPVALDGVVDALEWYGIHDRLDKLDVVETWEVLRAKLDEELYQTPLAADFQAMLGPGRDHSLNAPTYRVPVLGVESMQEAVNQSPNFIVPGQALPELLTIELDRQDFDVKTRSYVKVLNKVTLDDRINVGDISYTLYGFVVHKQTLQSYVYQPILRPEGPGSRWYSYSDSKEENQVKCLTKRQAVDNHEGKTGTEKIVGNDAVAYIAMYIRDDKAEAAFHSDPETEQWDVPEWMRSEVEKNKTSTLPLPTMPPPPADHPATANFSDSSSASDDNTGEDTPAVLDFLAFNSDVFINHDGPGTIDAYDPKWHSNCKQPPATRVLWVFLAF
jgi:hypothetical protein